MLRKITSVALLAIAASARADLPDGDRRSYPVSGISIRVPAGSTTNNTLPTGVLFDYWAKDRTLSCNAMLAPIQGGDAAQYASQLAMQIHGTMEAWDDKIDGEPAMRISSPVKLDKCAMRVSLVAVHQHRALVISGFGENAAAAEQAAKKVARTVTFSDAESPAAHTNFDPNVGFAFGNPAGRVVISAPAWLRLAKSDAKQTLLSGFDFATGKEPFMLALSFTDVAPAMHVPQLAMSITPQMKARFAIKLETLWSPLPDESRIFMSQTLRPLSLAPGGPDTFKIALVEAGPGRMLNMTFIINTEDSDKKKAYISLAEEMIKNVKIVTAPAEASAAPAN